jgi:cytochrome c oxidase assembly factor CtaG/polyferredoxin
MLDVGDAVVRSWALLPWITSSLILTGLVYLRGFRLLQATRPDKFPPWRALAFVAGLLSLWIALASPLDAMGGFLLTAHMVQHFILMSVAPPLLLLGYPSVPLLRGLPRPLVRDGLGPYFSMGWVHGVQGVLTKPIFGWLAMNVAYIGWHVPAAYELTLRSQSWHEVEHACFFFTSLAFWWNVVQPWPSKPRFSRWTVLLYLISADLINTALSASLSFSGKLFYPTYAVVPRISGLSPLNDQVAAGAFMWVIGSVVFLVPAIGITVQLLAPRKFAAAPRPPAFHILQASPKQRFDLLHTPVIGTFLRSRYGRMSLQSVSLLLSAIVITHGLTGHQMGSMNVAGVVPWNYIRAGGVVALILFGNLFCMACPFMLPRELGHRLGLATRAWPTWLRNKWMAAALMVLFFWAYEYFSLWDAPMRTAWLLIFYFTSAFVIDTFFRGASFCKYVCPIGQFNFVSSLFSPSELTVRSQGICASCETKDCIRGNEKQRGCELDLFLPQKVGNLDCTLCMDCVKACPHDNVAIYAMSPMREITRQAHGRLTSDPLRSGIRRLSARTDIAVVMLVVVFAAFLNAAAMIGPGAALFTRIGAVVPLALQGIVSGAGTFMTAFLLAGLAWLAAVAMRRFATDEAELSSTKQIFANFSLTLLPLGIGMWTAHLLFHFVTTWQSAVPLMQQFGHDIGLHLLSYPQWGTMGSSMGSPSGSSLLAMQLFLLDAGMLLTLYAGWRMARAMNQTTARSLRLLLPWAAGSIALYAFGFWVLLQPMQMRGMMMQG